MKQEILNRVAALRGAMRREGLDAFIIPSTDPHAGEYIPEHWHCRQWISGFTGSAGTAVVTLNEAALWTDSRYFLAAAEELSGTPFLLMKERVEGTPTIEEWLSSCLPSNAVVGLDGWVNSYEIAADLRSSGLQKGLKIRTDFDAVSAVWTENRPSLPSDKISIQPLAYAGISAHEKLSELRKELSRNGCDTLLVTALDEIAWTLNLRGTDVHCNPVFVSYLLINGAHATLYVDPLKLTPEVEEYLQKEGVDFAPYGDVLGAVSALQSPRVWLASGTNIRMAEALGAGHIVKKALSPVAGMKAVKNEAEIKGFRSAMERDGVALVKFLRWLKPAVEAGGQTEMSVDRKLTALRAEQPLYRDISFDTIAGYGPHGAIVHYEAAPETDAPLQPKGFLLLDSGAQYQDGTTDITRTLALGPVSDEERHVYTLVLKGHIALSRCRFPDATCGTQLDVCARYAMWQEALNFGHGTGHGVGSYLNVHEGPHQIRMNYMPAPLHAGMTVTDEPGLYLSGKFGVRIENTLLVVPFRKSEFGSFLQFEPLTLCPIDTDPIEWSLLRADEVEWLNAYHAEVRRRLTPYFSDTEDLEWLNAATAPRSCDGKVVNS